MHQSEFVKSLEEQLQLVGRPFAREEVLAFTSSAWPWIEEDRVLPVSVQNLVTLRSPEWSDRAYADGP